MTSQLPTDHFIKFSRFTPTTHRDVYPSISPSNPALSQAGKIAIITGASRGIGKARSPSIQSSLPRFPNMLSSGYGAYIRPGQLLWSRSSRQKPSKTRSHKSRNRNDQPNDQGRVHLRQHHELRRPREAGSDGKCGIRRS